MFPGSSPDENTWSNPERPTPVVFWSIEVYNGFPKTCLLSIRSSWRCISNKFDFQHAAWPTDPPSATTFYRVPSYSHEISPKNPHYIYTSFGIVFVCKTSISQIIAGKQQTVNSNRSSGKISRTRFENTTSGYFLRSQFFSNTLRRWRADLPLHSGHRRRICTVSRRKPSQFRE